MESYKERTQLALAILLAGLLVGAGPRQTNDPSSDLNRAWYNRSGGITAYSMQHTMTYDTVRNVTVLFGTDGATWEWDGLAWALRSTIGPEPWPGQSLAFDSVREVSVLVRGFPPNSETWEWDGDEWVFRTSDSPACTGDAARRCAVAFDSLRGVTWLFNWEETWAWDGSTWSLHSTSGPTFVNRFAMAFDAKRGVVVLFGGFRGGYLNDTWEWDGAQWTLVDSFGPPARMSHKIVYDEAREEIVLFGGLGDYFGTTRFDDTWTWNGDTWLQPANSGPSPRFGHAMTYDRARSVVVLFGGDPGIPDGETWEWDGVSWSLRHSAKTAPSPRSDHAMAYDSARQRTVLYGGIISGFVDPGPIIGDTWEWDGLQWLYRATAGPGLASTPKMVYDSQRGVTVLFKSSSTETWEWNGDAWSLRATSGPPPRFDPGMVFDSGRSVTVLFGGGRYPPTHGDTWEWDGGTWSLRATTGPGLRSRHTMAYDSARRVVVLFGGVGESSTMSDTWEWDGEQWANKNVQGPGPRRDHLMVFDSDRNVTLLVGGSDGKQSLGDVWEWDGITWTQGVEYGPPVRYESAIVYDSERRTPVMFGGIATGGSISLRIGDTWEYGLAGDYDGDGAVDLGDYGFLAECLTGPAATSPPTGCDLMDVLNIDLDEDADADLHDVAVFQRSILVP